MQMKKAADLIDIEYFSKLLIVFVQNYFISCGFYKIHTALN